MKFIDAHHHLWNLDAVDYIWLKKIGEAKPFGDPTPIQKNYDLEHYLEDVRALNDFDLVGSIHIEFDARRCLISTGDRFAPVTHDNFID